MLTTTTNTISHTGDGVATEFDTDFRIDEASHLVVTLKHLTTFVETELSTSEYSATGFGGNVTVTYPVSGSPLSSSYQIVLDRVVPLTQNLDIENYSGFTPENLEDRFDLIYMALQQLQTQILRNVFGPDTNDIVDAAVAAAALFLPYSGGTMTGRLVLKASATTGASLKLPAGTAPTTPENGDIWSTTTAIKARLNGATFTVATLELAQSWGAGKKQTFSHDATTAGFNLAPIATDPSGPANGDMWYEGTAHRPKVRVNGTSYSLGLPGLTAETLGEIAGENEQTDAAYTLALTDKGKVVTGNRATAQTFTIPANATVAFPVNTYITLLQIGAGQVTIAAAVGVTLLSAGGKTKLVGQYSSATLIKRATNTWVLVGDIST